MTEAIAGRQFPCPNCGDPLTWSPVQKALECPSCGTRLPTETTQTTYSTIFDRPASREPRSDSRPRERDAFRCDGCHAVSYVDRGTSIARCPFCGAAAVAPYDEFPDRFRPEAIVPFQTSEADARSAVMEGIGRMWLAPTNLARSVRTGSVKGAYLPFWSFDAHAVAHWDRAGGVRGIVEMDFGDVRVCADRGIDPDLVAQLDPFPARTFRAYDPRYAAGWTIVRALREYDEAAHVAHARMERELLEVAKAGQPPQEREKIQMRSVEYPRETCRQTLLPVWLFEYGYMSRRYLIVVNGATGKMVGNVPTSIGKVLALLALGTLAVALFFTLPDTALRIPGAG